MSSRALRACPRVPGTAWGESYGPLNSSGGCTLIKTLYTGGLITERTIPFYSLWVDMDEIAGEGEWNIGQATGSSLISASTKPPSRKRELPVGTVQSW